MAIGRSFDEMAGRGEEGRPTGAGAEPPRARPGLLAKLTGAGAEAAEEGIGRASALEAARAAMEVARRRAEAEAAEAARRVTPEVTPGVEAGRLVLEAPRPEMRPDVFTGRPWIRPEIPGIRPLPFPPPSPRRKTATELARSAIVLLNGAGADVIREAISTISAKNLAVDALLTYLERKVRVGEVLNQLAQDWSETTKGDFGDAFQMDRTKTPVMDAIVSIAILNSPELDEEILVENTPDTTPEDLLENRVIVDQWPRGGTVMQPPYLILVAVEYRSVAQAEEIVRSIMGQLVEHQGMKLPRPAVEKIRI